MKFRKGYFPSILVLFVVLLIFCVSKNEALPDKQTIKDIKEKIHLDNDGVSNHEMKKEKLAKKIEKDHEVLSRYFRNDKFVKMSELLGESTYIVSPEGEIIQGAWNVAQYWRDEKVKANEAGKEVELEFETLRAYITDETEVVTIGENTYDSVSYESFLFRIKEIRAGKTLRNQSGSGSEGRRHRDDCEWENF